MTDLLTKHGLIAICVAVFLEELGIPMPIPTDLLIIFAGVEGSGSFPRLVLWFVLLSIASAAGASGLYAIVRRGGRPLVDRFGRYVHLGPAQLARSEALLNRTGWLGIAVGRSIPGLRYVTVIACGLLRVPYWRFLTAHIVGSSVYIAAFLALGAVFGPTVAEWMHMPAQTVQLFWMLGLSVGMPLLLVWLYYRTHTRRPTNPSRRRQFYAVLLATFVGTTSLAGGWTAATILTELFVGQRPLDVTRALLAWLLAQGLSPLNAYVAFYAGLLLLCSGVAFSYYEVVLPRVAPNGTALRREIAGLAGLGGSLVSLTLVATLSALPQGLPGGFWRSYGTILLLLVIAAGMASFALTTVYGRALAITVLPSFRRHTPMHDAFFANPDEEPPSPEIVEVDLLVAEADR